MAAPLHLIGITGGIGSGKSLVCRVFSALGVPVYEADQRAKWLTTNDFFLKKEVVGLLGPEAYTPAGAYNRAYVAGRVFQDQALLQRLNALIHPRVRHDAAAWVARQPATVPYLLYEAALLGAAGAGTAFSKLIVVDAPPSLRLRRVLARDPQRSEAEVRAIMASQLPDAERLALADFVLENDGEIPLLGPILSLHRHLGGQ